MPCTHFEIEAEREARIRAEAKLEGYREAMSEVLAALARPQTSEDMTTARRREVDRERKRQEREAKRQKEKAEAQLSCASVDIGGSPPTSADTQDEPRPLPPVGVSPSPAPTPLSPLPPSPSPAPAAAREADGERPEAQRDTPPARRAPVALAAREARPPSASPAGASPTPEVGFFAWCQERRLAAFPRALPESPPPGWGSWYRDALAAVGGDESRLRAAWEGFLADDWARERKPVCPVKAFCGRDGQGEVWRRHVPGQGDGAARAARTGRGPSGAGTMREVRACAVCSEAAESTCGEQWLCYGCQARWHQDAEAQRLCEAGDWPGLARRTAAWVQEQLAGGAAAGGAA